MVKVKNIILKTGTIEESLALNFLEIMGKEGAL
jgi:hypothetical protein